MTRPDDPTTPIIHDVLIVGAGPCGLAVAARLREKHPSALFTDEEQARYHWIAQHARKASIKERRTGKIRTPSTSSSSSSSSSTSPTTTTDKDRLSIMVLDNSGPKWLSKWNRLFATFGIEHLRSPMFFHPDPRDRDSLLAYAYANDRADELEEITGCVGKEISKHRRKKERAKNVKAKPIVTIDERDRKDYYTPSTVMFRDFCQSCIRRYGLEEEHHIRQETVADMDYGPISEILGIESVENVFTVRTENATHYARAVVLAVGAGKPAIPAPFPASIAEGACHAVQIQKHNGVLVDRSVQSKIRAQKSTSVLVIGGGLTSAQIADAVVKSGVTQVHLLMRSAWKIKPFDVDLSWIAKFKNHQQASFWSADSDEERMEYVKEARNGGSITPRFSKKLKQHIEAGRLHVHCHTSVASQEYDAATHKWTIATSPAVPDLPLFDYIYFATGAAIDFESMDFLQGIRNKSPIETCGGLPVLTDDLKWPGDMPLFMTGRLATLRLGPGAGNLEGARAGAERVVWAIEDLLGDVADDCKSPDLVDQRRDSAHEKYVQGVGSRFASLCEEED